MQGTGRAIAACGTIVLCTRQTYMIEVRQTAVFIAWFGRLRDRDARSPIMTRIRRLSLGNPGDVKAVGEGARAISLAQEL
jgi:putative component of toxin-antitoxin plasmid stabilization module